MKETLQRTREPSEQQTSPAGLVARRNWSASTNCPYYSERPALQLKAILDQMEASKDYAIPKDPRLSKGSMVQKLSQAWLFLIDHLDPDGKYRQMRLEIMIIKDGPAGVTLHWRKPGAS
jgi:hypothetical protein